MVPPSPGALVTGSFRASEHPFPEMFFGQVEGGQPREEVTRRAHGVSGLFQGPLGKPGLPGMPGADGPPVSTLPASPLHTPPGPGAPRVGPGIRARGRPSPPVSSLSALRMKT